MGNNKPPNGVSSPTSPFGSRPRLAMGRPFTVFAEGQQFAGTVVQRLIPYADIVRDIATRLGARPYLVYLVWTQWSGGERGIGVEEVVRIEPLLPTPLIGVLNTVNETITPIGALEAGNLKVTEISPRYSEDYLNGRDEDGSPLPVDQNFYWEVFFPRTDGKPGERRRFVMKSVASYQGTDFEWTVELTRAIQDRTRSGDVE